MMRFTRIELNKLFSAISHELVEIESNIETYKYDMSEYANDLREERNSHRRLANKLHNLVVSLPDTYELHPIKTGEVVA